VRWIRLTLKFPPTKNIFSYLGGFFSSSLFSIQYLIAFYDAVLQDEAIQFDFFARNQKAGAPARHVKSGHGQD